MFQIIKHVLILNKDKNLSGVEIFAVFFEKVIMMNWLNYQQAFSQISRAKPF